MMFIPWIIRALVGRGIAQGTAERVAKPLLYLIALIALAGMLWGAVAIHDRRVVANHDATANAEVITKTTPANDRAADQRAADTIALNTQAQETRNAVHAAPDQAPAPTSLALGCERLRRQGKSLASVPACSRFAGGH
jgi:hypothetical protein